ncbi:MAG: peptidoglycan DD-metalloendopeptidase family protein [Chloroflexi bacterium]|nr:peptidoglycan DD-metalloendopeptidase family protein [Chloroflexota bacterium]
MTRRAPALAAPVFALFLLLALLGGRASAPAVTQAAPPADPTTVPTATAAPIPVSAPGSSSSWPPDLREIPPTYLVKLPLMHTDSSKQPRLDLITYRVIGGDTIVGIARRFGISPESILWANDRVELNPEFLRIGQELVVPPTTGVLHTVASGDTVQAIATKYKVDASAITGLDFNALTPPFALMAGQKLMVPGGEKPYQPKVVYAYSGSVPENATKGSGNFGWPIGGVLTQQFWTGHRAIDIGTRQGTSVLASDSGYVVLVANDDAGYGKHVMVNHGNGFETLYAHLSLILVTPGQTVRKGQSVGLSGNTGRSTGPHLHFEIRYFGQQRNPLNYLP